MSFGGLTLRDLEYVVEVARTCSFTAAAQHCAVSQPTLSAQVRKVEDQLGVAIFDRAGRKVRLTPAGAQAVEQARSVLGEARRLFDIARGARDPLAGDLRLGAIATLGPYLVPHLLGPLRAAFPQMRLILREGLTEQLCRDVLAGEIDAALLSLPLEEPRLAAMPLFFEPFVAVASRHRAPEREGPLRFEDLDASELILMDEGHCLRAQAIAACGANTASDRHAASIETLRHLVAAGLGHSLLPALAVPAAPLLDAELRYHALEGDRHGRIIGLAWRATDPRAEGFETLGGFIAGLEIAQVMPLDKPRGGG